LESLTFGFVRGTAFGELLIQPGWLATARAFAPRLTIWTRVGLARAGNLGTQQLATALGLNGGSHGFLALLFSLGLELSALCFELLNLGIEFFEARV